MLTSLSFASQRLHSHSLLSLSITLLLVTTLTSKYPSVNANLVVDPPQLAAEIGTDAVFTCSDQSQGSPADGVTVTWVLSEPTSSNSTTTTTSPSTTGADVAATTTTALGGGNNNANGATSVTSSAAAANAMSHLSVVNGTLTIRSVVLSDAGRYKCKAVVVNVTDTNATNTDEKEDNREAEVILVVYAMPDYLTYIIVVGSAIGVLALVAATGYAITERQERGRRKAAEAIKKPRGSSPRQAKATSLPQN